MACYDREHRGMPGPGQGQEGQLSEMIARCPTQQTRQKRHGAPAASKTMQMGGKCWSAGRGRGRARALCRQVGHGGARDAGRMSAAPIVDDLIVERDAEAAADRLLRDQAPVAEDMDGMAARSGRSMRWLGSAELAPSVCAPLLSGQVKPSHSGLGPAKD